VSTPPAPVAPRSQVDADHEQVEYDFADWSPEWRQALEFHLRGAEVPFLWEAPALLVSPRVHQEQIDDLVAYIERAPRSIPNERRPPRTEADATPPVDHGDHVRNESTPWATFRADLSTAARAWRKAPGLPLVTALLLGAEYSIGAAADSDPRLFVLLFGFAVVSLGFVGTQTIWYLRTFRGAAMNRDEILPFTWAYFGRYFRLGLIVWLITLPFTIVGTAIGGVSFFVVTVIWWLFLDVTLTFVTPALAYSTRSAASALRIGVRTIKNEWPRSMWYVLTPGLASGAVALLRPGAVIGPLGSLVLGFVGGLLALWFKGAITAFYLRRHPETAQDGAAFGEPYDWRWDEETAIS
jgi:hypothetical protein